MIDARNVHLHAGRAGQAPGKRTLHAQHNCTALLTGSIPDNLFAGVGVGGGAGAISSLHRPARRAE